MMRNPRDDQPYTDDSPWLAGQAINQPTDPQAHATADPNPWSSPQPSAAPAAPQTPAASAGSYVQDLGQTGAPAGQPASWMPSQATQPAAPTPDYSSLMQAVNDAPDPQSRAVAHDTMARTVQHDLEADGHTVTWKGDQLMVDGRPYELGTGPSTRPVASQPLNGPAGTPTAAPRDFVGQWLSAHGMQLRQSQPAGWQELVNDMQAAGYNVQLDNRSDGLHKGIILDGRFVKLADGYDNPIWGEGGEPANAPDAAPSTTPLQASPFASGSGQIPDWLQHPQADQSLMDLADTIPGWEDIYKTLSATSPEEQATSTLVTNLLEHPESLDQQTIDTMKAKNAEEAQAAAQAQDEELQHFGYASGAGNGLSDSPWLAGQRADTAWNARNAVIGSNRNIDLEAARTNQSDRRAAAAIGREWVAYRQGKSQAAIQTAVDSVGAKGNLEAAAKQLGMTRNQLLINYIGQNLNYDIDLKTLQQRGEEFLLDLAQRISEQRQQSDQFQANFGLDQSKFQHQKDEDAWLRAQQTFA